ncbi:MAG TPA: hypothetical protein VI260_32635 [Blastocatellia bacterium]
MLAGVGEVKEPEAQALLENSSAVIGGLIKAFENYEEKRDGTMRSKNTVWVNATIVTSLLSVAAIGSAHSPTEMGHFNLLPKVADRNGPFQ